MCVWRRNWKGLKLLRLARSCVLRSTGKNSCKHTASAKPMRQEATPLTRDLFDHKIMEDCYLINRQTFPLDSFSKRNMLAAVAPTRFVLQSWASNESGREFMFLFYSLMQTHFAYRDLSRKLCAAATLQVPAVSGFVLADLLKHSFLQFFPPWLLWEGKAPHQLVHNSPWNPVRIELLKKQM